MRFSKYLVVLMLLMMGVAFVSCDKEDVDDSKKESGVHRVEITMTCENELDYMLQVVPSSESGSCDLYLESDANNSDDASSADKNLGMMLQEFSTVEREKKIVYYTSENCVGLSVSLSLMAGFESKSYSYEIKFFVDGKETKTYGDEGTIDTVLQRMFNS